LVEDTRRADLIHRNLISSLTMRNPRRSEPERLFLFNEIDTAFRGTHRFSLTAPAELDFTLQNTHDDAEFFLTIQDGDDARFIPFMSETVPLSLQLNQPATGLLERYHSVYYTLELEKGNYVAEWEFSDADKRKDNLIGYLALLESDGGKQHEISRMNEYDVSHKKSAPITIREQTSIILRLENHHDAVDYTLQLKRAN
jgi:hypothetical protein